MTPAGLVRGLSFDDYLELDGEHFSTLKALDTSARHYVHLRDHGRTDSVALRVGRSVHSMVLTPELPDSIAVFDGPVRRGKAWEEFEAEHTGETIVRKAEIEDAIAMRDSVMSHPIARALLSEGEGEVTLQWDERGTLCKGRLDWLRPEMSVVELKTTRSIVPRLFAKEYAKRLYHAQAAFYDSGLAKCTGRQSSLPDVPTYVIAVENVAPFDVCVYKITWPVLEAGQLKVDKWLRMLEECGRGRRFPGCGDEVVDLVLPDWALADGEDIEIEGEVL